MGYEKKELPRNQEIISDFVASYSGREVRIIDSGGNYIEWILDVNKRDSEFRPDFYAIVTEDKREYHPTRNVRELEVDMSDGGSPWVLEIIESFEKPQNSPRTFR